MRKRLRQNINKEGYGEALMQRNQKEVIRVSAELVKLEKNLQRLKQLKAEGVWLESDWPGRLHFIQAELEETVIPTSRRISDLLRELLS